VNKKLYKRPLKAIREKCLDCSGGSHLEVRKCPIHNCALYPYRMGKRPDDETKDTLRALFLKNDELAT